MRLREAAKKKSFFFWDIFPKCGWVGWLIPKQGPNPSKPPQIAPKIALSTQNSPFVFIHNLASEFQANFKILTKFLNLNLLLLRWWNHHLMFEPWLRWWGCGEGLFTDWQWYWGPEPASDSLILEACSSCIIIHDCLPDTRPGGWYASYPFRCSYWMLLRTDWFSQIKRHPLLSW